MPIEPSLTRAARYRREYQFAQLALADYGLADASLRLIKYSNTALFQVDAIERFVLRLHPPERFSTAVLQTELHWLTTLRQQTSLWVPEPVPTPDGQLLTICELPNVADQRRAALFRWMPGHHKLRSLAAADADRMGACLGELHAFAAGYVPPPGFVRWKLDWGAFAESVVQRPQRLITLASHGEQVLAVAVAHVRAALASLQQRPHAFGLIHGDTNLSNFRFDRRRVGLLDFEAFCFGYFLFDVTRTLLDFEQIPDRAAQLGVAFHHGYALL